MKFDGVRSVLRLLAGTLLGLALASAQAPSGLGDMLDLARSKDFAAFRSSSNNPDLMSNDDSKRPIPGETVVLADLAGPGVVTHIWLTVAASEYGWPRLLRLRVYYDGSVVPSVDVPLGDFFGVGHGQERALNSLMVRDSSGGRSRNCYWPMPFRKSCRVTVTNEGRRRVSNLYYHVDWRKVKDLSAGVCYFHALYRQELPAERGKPYAVLNVQGRGHYVGTVLNVVQAEPGWFGEGDDFFYVDGQKQASIEGTGTEDYFNDAWGLRVDGGPYAGVTVAEGTGLGSRLSAYRWHIVDPVPFTRSLRFDLEHAGWTFNQDGSVRSAFEERADLFSSVAFWYQAGVAEGLPEPPYGSARLPHGNAQQIEVETALPEVKTEGGTAEVQKDAFWSRDLLLFRSKGPGAKLHIPFQVAEDGDYELVAQVAHSLDYGTYAVMLDGKPLGADASLEHEPGANLGAQGTIDAYHTELYVAEDHLLGWRRLGQGRHWLAFVCTGKNTQSRGHDLGIDTLVLARIGKPDSGGGARAAGMRRAADAATLRSGLADPDPLVREAATWALTQRAATAAKMAPELAAALKDPDPVVRSLAALALGNCDGCARAVLGRLIDALKDPDESVRMVTAEAIATLGMEAAPALSGLIQAAQVAREHVHVQRSLAKALGAIGPAAAPAIPVLEQLRQSPRVRWAADAAIREIMRFVNFG